jgi:hypothetical protein
MTTKFSVLRSAGITLIFGCFVVISLRPDVLAQDKKIEPGLLYETEAKRESNCRTGNP